MIELGSRSKNLGKLMENIVFLYLRRMQSKNPLIEIFYWKDYQQNEVDFMIKRGLNVEKLIQVTYVSSRIDIEKRELKALVKASNQLSCKNLLVLTCDYEEEEEIEGKKVKYLPIWMVA